SFICTKHPNHFVNAIIKRFDVLVPDRPIFTQTVNASAFEIIWSETKRNASPVIGSSAQHSCTPPIPFGTILCSVWFAIQLPATVAGVEVAERTETGAGATPG